MFVVLKIAFFIFIYLLRYYNSTRFHSLVKFIKVFIKVNLKFI